MSMEFVGKEALPNAYVKSIEINQSGKDSFSLTVVANIFDSIDSNGETSWFDPSNAITKAMRVGVVFSNDQQEIEDIKNGSL